MKTEKRILVILIMLIVNIIITLMILTLMILLFPALAHAQTPTCLTHTVQTDDWLSKLADKHLGNPLAYPIIVQATNYQLPQAGYATIENPDLIEPGWRVCIPVSPMVEQVPQIEPKEQGDLLFWQWANFTITKNEAGDMTGCLLRMTMDLMTDDTEFLYRCRTREHGEPVPEISPQMGPQS
jgi:hypothetical protein